MKRSDALAQLSRDHHVALTVALGLRRADAATAAGAAARFVAFMHSDGERHFDEEERELLPLADAALADRTRREHVEIRGRAAALRDAGDHARPEDAHAAGDLLRDHVRFEEQELFPHLEERLSPEELWALGERLS